MKKGTENGEYNFDNYEADTLTRPRDEAWDNFHSWKDAKVGDKVQGYIRDAFYRPEEVEDDGTIAFHAQRGITLETPGGELVNVTVKYMDFILSKTDNLRIGDPLTIVFEKELQPKKKSYKGAKVFGYYGKNLESTVGNKTVKQLTDEDRMMGGTTTENDISGTGTDSELEGTDTEGTDTEKPPF